MLLRRSARRLLVLCCFGDSRLKLGFFKFHESIAGFEIMHIFVNGAWSGCLRILQAARGNEVTILTFESATLSNTTR